MGFPLLAGDGCGEGRTFAVVVVLDSFGSLPTIDFASFGGVV
jgi:hypothetical protein